MAKLSKITPIKPVKDIITPPSLPEIRTEAIRRHVTPVILASIDFENPIIVDKAALLKERYSAEFFKLLKSTSKTPLIIVTDSPGETAVSIEVGYFSILQEGPWYNIIPVPSDILKSFI